MKIIVTGGAGFVGSHTCVRLLEEGHNVLILDTFVNSSIGTVSKVEAISRHKVDYHQCDILDESELNKQFISFKPDVVVHLAGFKSVADSIKKPGPYYQTNFNGTLNILSAMDLVGCQRIIFSSSATVYGSSEILKISEDAPLAPSQPYGRSKLFAEWAIRDWCALDGERGASILRYFNPLGAHSSGKIGEDSKDTPNNVMPLIVKSASSDNLVFQIFGDDYETRDGTGVRDYIHVMDVAEAHCQEVSRAASGVEIFNIGLGFGVSVLELIEAFERATGKTVPWSIAPRRDGDIGYSCADASKIRKVSGWKPKYSVEDMCSDSWRFAENQRLKLNQQ